MSSQSFAKAQVLGDGMQTFVGGGSVGGVARVCVSTVLQQLTADLTDDAYAVLLVLNQHDRHAAVESHPLLTASCTKYYKYCILHNPTVSFILEDFAYNWTKFISNTPKVM